MPEFLDVGEDTTLQKCLLYQSDTAEENADSCAHDLVFDSFPFSSTS